MTTNIVVTESIELNRTRAPALPFAPVLYEREYQDQLNNILRQYFNTLDNLIGQLTLMASTNGSIPVALGGTNLDAFGRLRISQPYTLFDSQNRFAADPQFDTATTGTGTTTYLANEAAVRMTVTGVGVGSAVRQTYRSFPYQPGKGLLTLATFVMDGSSSANLTQRVGYFNTQNGVYFQRTGGINSFTLRSYVTGVVSNARNITQNNWNGDKLDGTGASGYTLDVSKAQILWMDFEWLGVGSVRCGFIINGEYIVCHTFNNANDISNVYMTTAILPLRYEITSTTSAVAASLKQICSSVVSEGGYEQYSYGHIARRTTTLATISTTFLPLVSIRLASGRGGAVVLPQRVQVLPLTSQNYEVALVKNATLTGGSWVASSSSSVEQNLTATAMSFPAASRIVQTDYVTASGSGGTNPLVDPSGYNWDLQLGESLTGVSDIYTIAIRTVSGSTSGDAVGSLTFWDLTNGT